MDTNFLYPVVHDLTEVEYATDDYYNSAPSSYLCQGPPGCFSFQDLVNPGPVPTTPTQPKISKAKKTTRRKISNFFTRQLTRNNTKNEPNMVIDDQNDESPIGGRRTKFGDIYVLTREIFKGRMCTIWESVHKTTGNRYATKVIDRRNLSPQTEAAVLREAAMLDQVSGRSAETLTMIDFFDEPLSFYIVTDFADGGDLLNHIVKQGPMLEEDARRFAFALLKGVQHLHHNGICHRSLKPDNILLKGAGDLPIIADFGNAVPVPVDEDGHEFPMTDRCGTSSFSAPEILQRLPYDTQSDLWSIGVILYFVMAGYKPFEDKSKKALCQKITKADYTFPLRDWHPISRSAKKFISALLHPDPLVRMTVDEALEHPWIADGPLDMETEQKKQPVSFPAKIIKPGKIASVWKALARVTKRSDGHEEDSQSMTSQTLSVVSADGPHEFSNKRSRMT